MPEDEMWQRFTNTATRVIHLAQEEAKRQGVTEVGTEHLLLGLIREDEGGAAQVLGRLGVSLGRARSELSRRFGEADRPLAGSKRLTLSSNAKKVLEYALQEARELNPKLGLRDFVDNEHILLGLLRIGAECKGGCLLEALGVNLERVRQEVMNYLGGLPESDAGATPEPTPPARHEEPAIFKEAFAAAMSVYELSKKFPAEENLALTGPLRLSSREICAQIARAWGKRFNPIDCTGLLGDAVAHALEVQVWLVFATRCDYLSAEDEHELSARYTDIIESLEQMLPNPERWRG